MDTRSKILTGPWPAFARPLLLATGHFDVLRLAHARVLGAERERTGAATVLVLVSPRDGELLPARSRAELAAGLRVVDYVACARAEDAPCADYKLELEDLDEASLQTLRASVAGPSDSAASK